MRYVHPRENAVEKLFVRLGNLPHPENRVECKRSVQSQTPLEADLVKLLSVLGLQRAEVVKWQTHHLEGVAPRGMGVQVPPSAPNVSGKFS
jgi:hypothetical protein